MEATIHTGDALEVLRTLPDESVQCCVTSPPYYGVEGQIGLEGTLGEFVDRLVAVFTEVRRVLRTGNSRSSFALAHGLPAHLHRLREDRSRTDAGRLLPHQHPAPAAPAPAGVTIHQHGTGEPTIAEREDHNP